YDILKQAPDPAAPLKGKSCIVLGSYVTYGHAALGESFVEALQVIDGLQVYKETLSGTTMVDEALKGPSFITRMKTIPADYKADAFICQLSTNDARQGWPMGEIIAGKDRDSFDTKTIIGAMEYIIAYAQETWHCPVTFYTGTKFDNAHYRTMYDHLYKLKEKWDIQILDLWNNEMNTISEEKYHLYMADPIHPTKAGYLCWWLPEFEKFFRVLFKS
ncbi:MAG: SGNH/GDSL hydrolase family protein, partial [Eubacterium sp.]|nr:SGNH/GDSL hydrolase family protein [Eubacterium sp.]